MRFLTLSKLYSMGACFSAIIEFERKFGKKVLFKRLVEELHKDCYHKYPYWEGWLLGQEAELTIKMLDAGANVNASKDYALHLASKYGRTDVVKILIDAGANVHAYCYSPLYLALKYVHTDVLELLRQHM